MIYTIGHTYSYLTGYIGKRELGKRLMKLGQYDTYPGGAVFAYESQAQEYIRDRPDYSVFGVLADWKTETERDPLRPFHRLLINSQIVLLKENQKALSELLDSSNGSGTRKTDK